MKIKDIIQEQFKFDPSRITDVGDFMRGPSEIQKDFHIISHEPLVIQYQNNPKKRFSLNSQGQWSYLGTDKPLQDQNFARILDQVAGIAGTTSARPQRTTTPVMSRPAPRVFRTNPARATPTDTNN